MRKTWVLILFLACVIISFQPLSLSAPNYVTIYPGVFFRGSSSQGPIHFDSVVRSAQIRFLNSYIYFSNFRFQDGDYVWPSLGFQCSDNSNVTVTKADRTSVQYTVNNLTASTTTQNIVFPANWDRPTSVSGAWNWGYSGRTLSITALSGSPKNIRITFSDYIEEVNTINSRILSSIGFFVIVPIFLGAILLYASIQGDIDPSLMIKLTVVILIQAVIVFTLMAGTS